MANFFYTILLHRRGVFVKLIKFISVQDVLRITGSITSFLEMWNSEQNFYLANRVLFVFILL